MLKRILSLTAVLCTALCALSILAPAALAASPETYYIEVDVTNQITTVFRRSDGSIIRQMICSTGTGEKTPRGTFKLEATRTSTDRQAWYYIGKFGCYVKYATRIKGSILFHSIPYTAKDLSSIDKTALYQLGSKASHGCIRLNWEDAYWIACNCPDGTEVTIFNGAARKEALRRLLLEEGFTQNRGLSYREFLDANFQGHGFETLGRGAIGEEVSDLQERLIRLGFLGGSATGIYDNATVMAVMRYQSEASLPVNGVASQGVIESIQANSENAERHARELLRQHRPSNRL